MTLTGRLRQNRWMADDCENRQKVIVTADVVEWGSKPGGKLNSPGPEPQATTG